MLDSSTALVVAGGNGRGNQSDQLNCPTDVLIDKETDSLIICDSENRRVLQWSLRGDTTQGVILIDSIACRGLAMDDQRYLYISDTTKHEVRRYQIGHKNGDRVAGGNGNGSDNNQLNFPTHLFVDRKQSVYVSDYENHRVMKWDKDAQEGIALAGNRGEENEPIQLAHPEGLFVDTSGSVYVADSENHRVMRWPVGATNGTRIAGGNGEGNEANQFSDLAGLSFDQHGNLYVVDKGNNRVQRFPIKQKLEDK
jgi:sugar lactone lactonase YvrE